MKPAIAALGHIQVENLRMCFETAAGATEATTDVSLEIHPGEFVSLVGPSGCGKSTVLNAVAGFIHPTSGRVLMDGAPVHKPGSDRAMVFQQFSLFPWMSVRKNVEFGLKARGMPRFQREQASRTLLGLAGLLAFENHYPTQLSGGMRQRVGIVRALAISPRVLLMDEPFGALDAQTRVVMQQILTNMWQRFRISVLFITHDIDEAIFLSDRVYLMTARPGTIGAVLPVPLARPRTVDMADTEAYRDLKRHVQKFIQGESVKALGKDLGQSGLQGFAMDVGPDGIFRKI